MLGLLARLERGTKVLSLGSQALTLDGASANRLRCTLGLGFQYCIISIIILATIHVQVTHSVMNSITNIYNLLRSDGFLMILELTGPLP